jgi:hypothetical protein
MFSLWETKDLIKIKGKRKKGKKSKRKKDMYVSAARAKRATPMYVSAA